MTGKRSQTSPIGSPSSGNSTTSDKDKDKDQDRFLPIANLSRIMKKSLPANAKISKEAKESVQECVSEFISFITGEASDKCQREKRKTINGEDLLWAMTTLGFENYVGPLKVHLNKYREVEGDQKNSSSSMPNRLLVPADIINYEENLNIISPHVVARDQMTSREKSYADNRRRVIGGYGPMYGENNLVSGDFNIGQNVIRENNGDAMAAHLHHGVEW